MPAKPDCLAYLQMVNLFSNFGNLPHHFMTGNDGVLSHAPFIVEHAQVTMADTAVVDINFYLLGV
jgi:hypothetical protein